MAKDTGLPAKGDKTHLYAQGGVYTVTIADEDNVARNKKFTVVVPFGPIMTVKEDITDSTRRAVQVTVNNANEGEVVINWGDGTPTSVNAGDGTDLTRHRYLQAGVYTITATDADDPTRSTTAQVTVPFTTVQPVMTISENPAVTSGLGIEVRVDNHGNGSLNVDWGDGTTHGIVEGTPNAGALHTYAAAGTYTVTATDIDDPYGKVTQQITVPFGVAPTVVLTEETADPRRQVRATVTNARNGRNYEVLWEAGGTPEDLLATSSPAYSLPHTYTADGTFAVTVRDKADTTLATTENVTVPFTGPLVTVAQNGTELRGVTATIGSPTSGATYEVNWGDSETWNVMAGDPPTLTHAYPGTDVQTFKISVRNQADQANVSTRQVTVPFESALAAEQAATLAAADTSSSTASTSSTSTRKRSR